MNSIKSSIQKHGQVILNEKVNWYPGHMHRGMKHLIEEIKNMDLFLEIRDARIPISSRNYNLDQTISLNQKQKIILFNKYDLCNKRITNQIIQNYNNIGIPCMAIEAKSGKSMQSVIEKSLQMKPPKYPTIGCWMMVGGVPNVGKSTLLNQLRHKTSYEGHNRKKIAKTAPLPCTTKKVQGFKVCDHPLAYLIDTPGICVPNISNDETALKLSLMGCINDKISGREILLDYMLYVLNKNGNRKYLEKYKLEHPVETAEELVMHVRDKYHQIQYEVTFDMILKHFREGKLGNVSLDYPDSDLLQLEAQ